jgi:hypothetical protein
MHQHEELPEIETEPILAYRTWKLVPSAEGVPILYSIVQDYCWLPFEPACGAVNESNSAGIYALKAPSDIYLDHDSIPGVVNLWGTVVEYEQGYRAEFAYPKEFWVPEDYDVVMAARLEETYGVPVLFKPDIKIPPEPLPLPPMKFTSGIQPGIMEITRDTIYDRVALRGCGRIHLFCQPLGQTDYTSDGLIFLKDYHRTNMLQAGMLPAPQEFLIKAIRCVFLENGRPVPITDPIYWETTLELTVCMKHYWLSPCAYVADPAIVLGGTDWSKIPPAERCNLLNLLSNSLGLVSPSVSFAGGTGSVDGVRISQQMNFGVRISNADKWPQREVLCSLEGVSARPIM